MFYKTLLLILFLFTTHTGESFAEKNKTMEIKSSAFQNGGMIPSKYTCDGEDISLPLSWNGVPAETQSLALVSDDPDAPVGTWVHWVIYNIPAKAPALPQGTPKEPRIADGTLQGINDFGRVGYGGPCPPPGLPHRYFFRIYALDAQLALPPRASKNKLELGREKQPPNQTHPN